MLILQNDKPIKKVFNAEKYKGIGSRQDKKNTRSLIWSKFLKIEYPYLLFELIFFVKCMSKYQQHVFLSPSVLAIVKMKNVPF